MLAAMTLDYGNASTFYERQPPLSGGWAGDYLGRVFDRGLLPEAGLRKRLTELRTLSRNWDGEGADVLSELTLKNARNVALLLARCTRFPDITPNAGDIITFEWETESGSALMEVGHSTYSFLMKTKAGKRSTDTGNLDHKDDIAALGSLIQRTLF
jgi:hypothetical protein